MTMPWGLAPVSIWSCKRPEKVLNKPMRISSGFRPEISLVLGRRWKPLRQALRAALPAGLCIHLPCAEKPEAAQREHTELTEQLVSLKNLLNERFCH